MGYDLYCQMVTEAVAELKGEELREPAEGVACDLPVEAHLPSSYVGRELRLEAYRRLATVTTEIEVDDIKAEWIDRYGAPPPPPKRCSPVARLRAECHRLGIREVVWPARDGAVDAGRAQDERRGQVPSPHARDGVYKADGEVQLRVPKKGDLPSMVVDFLHELRPPDGEQPEGHR